MITLWLVGCGGNEVQKINAYDDTHDLTQSKPKNYGPEITVTEVQKVVIFELVQSISKKQWSKLEDHVSSDTKIWIRAQEDLEKSDWAEFDGSSLHTYQNLFDGSRVHSGIADECVNDCCAFGFLPFPDAHDRGIESICVDEKTQKISEIVFVKNGELTTEYALKKGESYRFMHRITNPTVWTSPDGTQVTLAVVEKRGKKSTEDKGYLRVTVNGKSKDVIKYEGDNRMMSSVEMIPYPEGITFIAGEYGKLGTGKKKVNQLTWDSKKKRLKVQEKWRGEFIDDMPKWANRGHY